MEALTIFFWVSCLAVLLHESLSLRPHWEKQNIPCAGRWSFVSTFQLKADVPGCEEVPGKLAESLSQGMIELCRQMEGKHASWRCFGCHEQTLYPMHLHLQPAVHMHQLSQPPSYANLGLFVSCELYGHFLSRRARLLIT